MSDNISILYILNKSFNKEKIHSNKKINSHDQETSVIEKTVAVKTSIGIS